MWGVAVAILLLMLCIEALVDRHYGLAVIFVTPLTIFIAEYGSTVSLAQFGVQEVIPYARYHYRLYGGSQRRLSHTFSQAACTLAAF